MRTQINVTSLTPDSRLLLNTTADWPVPLIERHYRRHADGSELTDRTSSDALLVSNGGLREGTDFVTGLERSGPLVVPFQQHLMGYGMHGFNADNSVVISMGASTLRTFSIVECLTYDTTFYLPEVTAFSADSPRRLFRGILKGVIEDGRKRTSRGSAVQSKDIYAVQTNGMCLAWVFDEAVELVVGDPLSVGSHGDVRMLESGEDDMMAYFVCGMSDMAGSLPVDYEFPVDGCYLALVYVPYAGASVAPHPGTFGFKGISADQFSVYGGTVRWGGKGIWHLADQAVTIDGGTEAEPGHVCLRIPTVPDPDNPDCPELVFLEEYPQDDSTFLIHTLHQAYLQDGVAKYVRDCRYDWEIRSPI